MTSWCWTPQAEQQQCAEPRHRPEQQLLGQAAETMKLQGQQEAAAEQARGSTCNRHSPDICGRCQRAVAQQLGGHVSDGAIALCVGHCMGQPADAKVCDLQAAGLRAAQGLCGHGGGPARVTDYPGLQVQSLDAAAPLQVHS